MRGVRIIMLSLMVLVGCTHPQAAQLQPGTVNLEEIEAALRSESSEMLPFVVMTEEVNQGPPSPSDPDWTGDRELAIAGVKPYRFIVGRPMPYRLYAEELYIYVFASPQDREAGAKAFRKNADRFFRPFAYEGGNMLWLFWQHNETSGLTADIGQALERLTGE